MVKVVCGNLVCAAFTP
ncbi:DUF3265 domain-containing protein [Vibrio vulnificus]|nr:DUF3265 domain-containing protein [Vibrio cholerae]MDT8826846.1 DUF3265 domain-containing protein [Vibrio vulnificus]